MVRETNKNWQGLQLFLNHLAYVDVYAEKKRHYGTNEYVSCMYLGNITTVLIISHACFKIFMLKDFHYDSRVDIERCPGRAQGRNVRARPLRVIVRRVRFGRTPHAPLAFIQSRNQNTLGTGYRKYSIKFV